jgi:hypothetical protein
LAFSCICCSSLHGQQRVWLHPARATDDEGDAGVLERSGRGQLTDAHHQLERQIVDDEPAEVFERGRRPSSDPAPDMPVTSSTSLIVHSPSWAAAAGRL